MNAAGRIVAALVVTVAVLLLTFTGHGGPAHDDSPPEFTGCRIEPSTTPEGFEIIAYPTPTVITEPGFTVPCPAGTITYTDPGPSSLHACHTDCGIPD